jgi:hypothetical protein
MDCSYDIEGYTNIAIYCHHFIESGKLKMYDKHSTGFTFSDADCVWLISVTSSSSESDTRKQAASKQDPKETG